MANTPTFTLRMPPELRAELERRAANDRRSLANYVTGILARHVEETYPEHLDQVSQVAEAAAPRKAGRKSSAA